MGFTGKKALEFKFKYIDAFNAMERALNKLPEEKLNPVLQAELAVTRAKTAKANALYRIAMATASETSKQTLLANAAKEITGEMIIPALQHKEYSATEVAKLVNASSANKVGRICNKLGLKAEQPGQNEYGRWASSKSKYSNKETPQWLYFDKGVTAIRQAMLKN
ncbi:Phage anti-repressor protein [Loigolactobacillus rennini DSM 20253]|uniref:Phage anti-repressor protein n=2 Tax=Loigolactobacillus rennini TaxID=238013 RepID=A0A0R2DA50_9LACO|nr:Phage anti-repressor protein [Loigolactobacillus rennini DSM 20253]